MSLSDDVNAAFSRRAETLRTLRAATEHTLDRKRDLQVARVFLINQGLAATNDKGREAELADKTEEEREAVATAEKAEREAKLEFELADQEVSRLSYLIQIMQLDN